MITFLLQMESVMKASIIPKNAGMMGVIVPNQVVMWNMKIGSVVSTIGKKLSITAIIGIEFS